MQTAHLRAGLRKTPPVAEYRVLSANTVNNKPKICRNRRIGIFHFDCNVIFRFGQFELDSKRLRLRRDGDSVSPYSQGKLLASNIPGARFVALNSDDHLLSDHDPEFAQLVHRIRQFLLA